MKLWRGIAVGAALVCVFLPPLLSGSNHTCPVLRQEDLDRGPSAQAIPAFARKYNVDCTYCHTAWPQLNRQGYIFRRLGYRMPWEVPTSRAPAPTAGTIPPAGGTAAPSGGTVPTTPPPGGGTVTPAVNDGLKKAVTAAGEKQPATPEKIAEGKTLFTQMQCATCHSDGGNTINPAKPIKGADFFKKYSQDDQIAQLVKHGVSGTAMPAYGTDRLSDEQLSSIIAYIRSLTP